MNGRTKVTINFEHNYNEANVVYIRETFGAMVQKEIDENKLPYTLELIKNDSLNLISYRIRSNGGGLEPIYIFNLYPDGDAFCDTDLPSKHYKIISECGKKVSTYLKDKLNIWNNEVESVERDIDDHLFFSKPLKLSTMMQYVGYDQEEISDKEKVSYRDKESEIMYKLKETNDKISYHEKVINDPNSSPTLLHISTISLPILLENKSTIEDYIRLIQKIRING